MSLADWVADRLFCTECFRLRISPGHWLTLWMHSGDAKPVNTETHEEHRCRTT